MTRRLLCACVGAALMAALGTPGRTAAKPPDLPMNEIDTVKPQAAPTTEGRSPSAPWLLRFVPAGVNAAVPDVPPATPLLEVLPPSLPTPTFFRLLPTARKTLAGSLLFNLHPLLTLVPIEQILDAPFDHPQRVAGDDVVRDMPHGCEVWGGSIWCSGEWSESWMEWARSHWSARHAVPSPEQHEGYVSGPDAVTFVAGLTPADEVVTEPAPAKPAEDVPHKKKHKKHHCKGVPAVPQEEPVKGFTCPYLRRQAADRHACQMADPQVGRDVLENLDYLLQADRLMEQAEEFAQDGDVALALECYAAAADLCPGSPCSHRASDAMMELLVGIHGPTPCKEEAAQAKPCHPGQCRQTKAWWEWLVEAAQAIGCPCPVFINIYSSDPNARIKELIEQSEDLRQIECEWEQIWFSDQPSYLTPEKDSGESAAVKKIEACLKQPINLSCTNEPLKKVLDDLHVLLDVNIYLDEAALAKEGISSDHPISAKLEQIALKSALNLILRNLDLAYVIKDEVLQVTTRSAAQPALQTCTYQVGDLLGEKAEAALGPKRCETAGLSDEDRLIKLITNTVAPRTWSEAGGAGTIDYFPLTRSLVVNQSMDVQEQIADLLAALHRHLEGAASKCDRAEEQEESQGVEEQVRGLMKACRLLMVEGMHAEAAELARQAYALDPERVMADPLVYKMHLLADKPVKRSCHPSGACESSGAAGCPYCPAAGKPIPGVVPEKPKADSGPASLLTPPLPPVDPGLTDGLDEVLTEAEAGSPRGQKEFSLEDWLGGPGQLKFGVGMGAGGGLRLSGELSVGGSVYHLLCDHGWLAVWKTADDSDKPAGEDGCPR